MTQLNIGVIGLGRAFTLMLPTFVHDNRVKLVAATDPLPEAHAQFEKDFNAPTYESVEALCANPSVKAVYVASPHQFHAEHVCMAAAHGKHVLVEKPMALSLAECTRMIDACQSAGVHLIVGHSHSFNAPIRRCREIIESGAYGAVRMITAMNFTDFLYRPRRPEELMTAAGGGVIHSQAAHQIDIVRLLGGGLVSSVRAHTGAWDRARPTEGAYSALLGFENGAFATATYSGYGHYDSDELMDNTGELGQRKNPDDYGGARQRLAKTEDETTLKAARNYGGSAYTPSLALPDNVAHQHFGQLVISCDKVDLRPSATGVTIYADSEKLFVALPAPGIPRIEVIDEWIAAVQHDRQPTHSGQWARATTAVCLAMLESASNQTEQYPAHQIKPD
jgi:phthalate 4,5-cis-dihydrodiol dehydrogenase